MRKGITTRFYPLQTLKNIFFKDLILVARKCTKTQDVEKYLLK
jgi:hypothetical protein